MHKRRQRGFTLIEILIVLVILGTLFTLLGQRLWPQFFKAQQDLTKMKLQQVAASVNLYSAQYGRLPQRLEDLTACNEVTGPGCTPLAAPDDLVDAWKNPLRYEAHGRNFVIRSLGADGAAGGTGADYDVEQTGP